MGKIGDSVKREFIEINGKKIWYYSLVSLEKVFPGVSKLPASLRILLESMMRNLDGKSITEHDLEAVINWNASSPQDTEISFKVSRVLMQDFTGVPAIVDLASMRDAAKKLGKDPKVINPVVPVDLVIDHSVQVDYYGDAEAFNRNRDLEFKRNEERYRFLKWAKSSFDNLRVYQPSAGIVHQINLEYIASVIGTGRVGNETIAFPDTLVGTDSHTTMINGTGVLGWGVGGIEAEAAMLGEPITIQLPKVVGVNLHGKLRSGITATDLVLTLTETFRKHNVVGKFLEFYGDGLSALKVPDRATISNMCPEYGATLALFPIDTSTIDFIRATGRKEEQIQLVEKYAKTQSLFGSRPGISFSEIIDVDLGSIDPSVSGPKLPQQRVPLSRIRDSFLDTLETFSAGSKAAKQVSLRSAKINIDGSDERLSDGDVVIAAITSCTNTSNPRVMVGAGLLAKKAVEHGLTVNRKVKTSLAPGSRVVMDYLDRSGLTPYLEKLGFYLAGYGCTTCIGNSGPLNEPIQKAIMDSNLSVAAVLSGNRNFEARIHRDVKANYLMSPPLVVAFAIAGTVAVDLEHEPIGKAKDGRNVFLKDIWPSDEEIDDAIKKSVTREMYIEKYSSLENLSQKWNEIEVEPSELYSWDKESTYIRNPTYFDGFILNRKRKFERLTGAFPLLVVGDSVTTDHISPAGAIGKNSPAGKYLMDHHVSPEDFNSFGSRRGNHEVMIRGTFGNNRIRNLMVDKEGPYTISLVDGKEGFIFDISEGYKRNKTPLIVFAGSEYGTGSSRDWAAKGPYLLGIKAVIARSFERIHRSNLVGMGIVPLEFPDGVSYEKLGIDMKKPVSVSYDDPEDPRRATLSFTDASGKVKNQELKVRIDTPVEREYYRFGGILQYVLNGLCS